jgi:predicted ATPase
LLEIGSEGESELQRALVVAREQEAKLWELRAAMSLARLRHDQGRYVEGRNLFAPVGSPKASTLPT